MLKTRILLGLFLIVGVFSACKKELSSEKQEEKDDALILDFIAKNNIPVIKHSSGFYYQIIKKGTGEKPTISTNVFFNYVGKSLNGKVLEKSNAPVTFAVNRLSALWEIAIPLINKGGSIRLFVPSALAYGSYPPQGSSIPKNAVLDFTIDLIDDQLSSEKQAEIDDKLIIDFITKNNIVAIKHSSGLYYQIFTQGGGVKPTTSSSVSVTYQGKLLNGNVFDYGGTGSFVLNRLIVGWQIGIPLINKGGSIRLILPSALAYGPASPGSGIPKNSVLDFKIDLIDVN